MPGLLRMYTKKKEDFLCFVCILCEWANNLFALEYAKEKKSSSQKKKKIAIFPIVNWQVSSRFGFMIGAIVSLCNAVSF